MSDHGHTPSFFEQVSHTNPARLLRAVSVLVKASRRKEEAMQRVAQLCDSLVPILNQRVKALFCHLEEAWAEIEQLERERDAAVMDALAMRTNNKMLKDALARLEGVQ